MEPRSATVDPEPLVREHTEAPVSYDAAGDVYNTSDRERAAKLWRRLLEFRRRNPNSRMGTLPMPQLFETFRVVLAEPGRFSAVVGAAAADKDGEAASLLSSSIPASDSLWLAATGDLCCDSIGEVLPKRLADLLLLIPDSLGSGFEASYLENAVVTVNEVHVRKNAIVAVSRILADFLLSIDIHANLNVFLFGSVGLATVLPNGDNDVTLVLGDPLMERRRVTEPWIPETPPCGSFDSFLQERSQEGTNPTLDFLENARAFISRRVDDTNRKLRQGEPLEGPTNPQLVVNAEVINAAVPLLKLEYGDGSFSGIQHIDISLDQMGGRTSMIFVHQVDEKIGHNNLFRRTLLLVKHYCSTVLRVLGAQAGGLGSYTVTVMLMAIFNGLPRKVLDEGILEQSADGTSRRVPITPLQILVIFLDYYSRFDFDSFVVTIFGPMPVTAVQLTNHENTEAARGAFQQWVAISDVDGPPGASSGGAGALNGSKAGDYGSPNSNFNPQGEMHKANGFNIFGRSFKEHMAPTSGTLNLGSVGSPTGPMSGCSSETGAVSPIDLGALGKPSEPPLQGGDFCPPSILSALEAAPGAASPPENYHYTDNVIREDFVEEFVLAQSVEDQDLAFAQKVFYFPRTARQSPTMMMGGGPKGVHQYSASNELPSSSSATNGPKPIAAALFKVRMMNIRDPLRPFSNLTPGVQRNSLCRIQAGFAKGAEALRAAIYSVCFTDIDGSRYNAERVLKAAVRELGIIKEVPTEFTPNFFGVHVDFRAVLSKYERLVAPSRQPDPDAPPVVEERNVDHRHIEGMTLELASHLFSLLPPAVADPQQFWSSILQYTRQATCSSEAVTENRGDESSADPSRLFAIFKMSNADIRRPISEFKAAARDHHQHLHQQQQHPVNKPPHHNGHQQQSQMGSVSNGAVGRLQSYSRGAASPPPESHTSVTAVAPLESSVVSRPNSQQSSAYRVSPSYGKSGKQPGNAEAPPLPRSGAGTPIYGQPASPVPPQVPAPRSHNPYVPSNPNAPTAPPLVADSPAQQQVSSPVATGRGRGGRGGNRGRGIQ